MALNLKDIIGARGSADESSAASEALKSLKQRSVAPSGAGQRIDTVADLPQGEYLSFRLLDLPHYYTEHFLVLTASTDEVLLIVAEEAWASHPQFELIKLLRNQNLEIRQMYKAASSVIQAAHSKRGLAEVTEQTTVESAAWQLINQAVEAGASDIHIETRTSHAQVFFRVHGERYEQPSISHELAHQICSVLYIVHADSSSKDITWSSDRVFDTSIDHHDNNGKPLTIRFSSAPIYPASGKNFHCVLRLLRMDVSESMTLEKVGYTSEQINVIEDMIVGAQGCVLLVGPTNSGKSTSMQAIIKRIYDRRGKHIKTITIEKPVEYIIDGACQMGVSDSKRTDTSGQLENIHESLIRATLRQDPDVVMVGEIRDAVEAEPVKNLVLAGRKLLATIHVYEAMAVFERLLEMGIPRGVLTMDGFISGVVYQRLVSQLCPYCSEPARNGHADGRIRPQLWSRIGPLVEAGNFNVRIRSHEGCHKCHSTGVIGRVPCAELLQPDPQFLSLIRANKMEEAREYWETNQYLNIQGIGVSALAHAVSRMIVGEVDPREVEIQIGLLNESIVQKALLIKNTVPHKLVA